MPGRERHFDRCLFILSGQTYENIEICVVVQYSGDETELTLIRQIAERWRQAFKGLHVILNASDTDARAHSLNLGLQTSNGRYVAFLDDDDKVYPPHYERLISALTGSEFAWAYSDVVRAGFNKDGQLVSRTMPFRRDRYSFLFHLQDNFIPIHSFLIDRERAPDMPSVDETLCRLEDYDFLLRLAVLHEPLYVHFVGCEYCIREDGTNSVMEGTEHLRTMLKKKQVWNDARIKLETKKYALIGWWMREVFDLPLSGQPASALSTVPGRQHQFRELLALHYGSISWRITRPMRDLRRRMSGVPAVPQAIPPTEEEALAALLDVQSSLSWEITAPLRLAKRMLRRRH
nr:glycosyltransferase family 2 protein [Paraburkholderia fungorum]